ncbi:hypothetical protein cyc_08445 [Cyclospora cayetanensis]|uniref:Uncharacterized protein n=1 Tax=Cyclospora cayetanensis TaxID=88456 RepID=A0A1D3CX69_9EIME|nr:hypothetical protein cyc_08445 [Cyclospora cayetanensis]
MASSLVITSSSSQGGVMSSSLAPSGLSLGSPTSSGAPLGCAARTDTRGSSMHGSCSRPSSVLRHVAVIEKQAHARSSSCCCCTDTHVFVGGTGLVGTIFVWRIPPQTQQQHEQGEQNHHEQGEQNHHEQGEQNHHEQGERNQQEQQKPPGLEFVGLLGQALDALQKVMGDALALTPGAAASAAAAAWRGSRNSSLYARRDSFFTSPVGDELLQHGVFEASQVYVHLLLNSPSPRCVLGAEGKGFAVLGAAISGSGSASTSRIGDDLQAVEFLQDGKLVVAAASCPSAYPLGIYETQKGHLLAAFAATALLLLIAHAPPPSVASSTPATAVAKGRYLAAASDVGGCLAMAFIEDEKLAELHRHYDSCAKEEEQQAAAGGRADATPADQRAPVVPQILPLQAFFINERAVMSAHVHE